MANLQAKKIIQAMVVAGLLITGVTRAAPIDPDSHVTVVENQGEKKYILNFQSVDLPVLVNTISQITGKNFIIDPRVKGKVTVVSGKEYDADEVYDVFLSVLDVHNFVAIDNGEIIKVLPKAIAKQTPTQTKFSSGVAGNDEQITEVYKLKYSTVQAMLPALKPLLPPTSHFAAHVPSNSIIITGSASSIDRVLKIARNLDQPSEGSDIHVVYMQYAKAKDMVGILNKVLAEAQKEAAPGKAPGSGKVAALVQADEATNSLIINAPLKQFQQLQQVIEKLDVRRAQVFVEVLIAEVTKRKESDFGVSFSALDKNLPKGQGSGSTGFSPGSEFGLSLGYITRFVTNLNNERVPDFQILLHALQSDNDANIVSTPNLLTLDNETAEITVASEVPFVTGQFTTNTGTTTTTTTDGANNAGQTTTSNVNPFQTIERKDVGLILKITPQINKGNTLRLDVEQELSSIAKTSAQGAADLITNKRTIKASVLVDNGKIVVIGGLITDELQGGKDGIPGLANIPLLGALFRKKTKTAAKTNLMVFLRPWIVRSYDDLAEFTEDKYGQVQKDETSLIPKREVLLRKETHPILPPLNSLQNTKKPLVADHAEPSDSIWSGEADDCDNWDIIEVGTCH